MTISPNFVSITGNSFKNNGSHGKGVLVIENMPNVSITDGNIFESNSDLFELSTTVMTHYIENGHYIDDYLDIEDSSMCISTIYIDSCAKVTITDLDILKNSCSALINNLTAGLTLIKATDIFIASNINFSEQHNMAAYSSALFVEAT